MAQLSELVEYYPEIEVTLRDECATGHRHATITALKRKISAFKKNDQKVRNVYIGIASGVNYTHALWRRYDDYKRGCGINEIIAVYKSSSRSNCKSLEYDLEKYYRNEYAKSGDEECLLNRAPGGAGRPSMQPYHYVYLAIVRLG